MDDDSMALKWFTSWGGREFGPFKGKQLAQLARDGRLRPSDRVRREDRSEWNDARDVPGLFESVADSPLRTGRHPAEDAHLVPVLRCLIVAEIVLFVIVTLLYFLEGLLAESALQESGFAVEPTDGENVAFLVGLFVFALLVTAQITSWVGLLNFWSWSRWLYVGVVAAMLSINLVASPFGFSFTYVWEFPAAVNDLASTVTGALLVMIFVMPLAQRFDPRRHPYEAADG